MNLIARGRQSLAFRMMAWSVLTALLSVLLVGTAGVALVKWKETEATRNLARAEVDRLLALIDETVRAVGADGDILSRTPPIQGLIRAEQNGGFDPRDGSSGAAWRQRLQNIFIAFHNMRPEYLQIRLIGMADGGHEIIRVDKVQGKIRLIGTTELQDKSAEPYVIASRDLTPGQHYISPPSWNREHGRIQEPRQMVMRFVTPVFTPEGRLHSIIVINVDMLQQNARLLDAFGLDYRSVITDGAELLYLYDPETGQGAYYPPQEAPLAPRLIERISATQSGIRKTDGTLIATAPIKSLAATGLPIRLALIFDAARLSATSHQLSTLLALFGTLVLLLAGLIAYRQVKEGFAPLLALNREIRAATETGRKPALDTERPDEIGQLSASFAQLLHRLEQRERQTRIVFDGVGEGVATLDRKGRLITCNPAFAAIFGRSPDNLQGEDFGQLLDLPDRISHAEHVERWLASGESEGFAGTAERTGLRSDGTPFPLELGLSLLPGDEASISFAVTLRDISDRQAAEQERAGLITRLRASNAELRDFAYAASHDLKAPLRAIASTAQWLEEDLDPILTPETRQHLDFLRSRVARMAGFLDDLLAHASIGRGDTPPSRLVTGTELEEELRQLCPHPPDFTLRFSAAFGAITIAQMPAKIVLLNLISNAIKHHDRTDGLIIVDAERREDRILFSVADDGPGIAPEFHEKIFGLFQTLRPRDQVEGSGMGLAIARKHVEHAGGRLTLRSDGAGQGALFRFTLPAPPETPAELTARASTATANDPETAEATDDPV